MADFNSYDAYLLAYEYPQVDLQKEITWARSFAGAVKVYDSMPCSVLWSDYYNYRDNFANLDEFLMWVKNLYDFDYGGYINICKEALRCRAETAKAKPLKLPSKRIDVDDIKARNDIVAVIEQYTPLRKSGHNRFTGKCPLHEDKHPSLTVYADNQSWWCFSCNKGGDVIDFIKATQSCDFKQAAVLLGTIDGTR